MTIDLTKAAAYSDKTPYELWQEQEGIPIYHGLGIDDLKTLELGPWQRKAAAGAFINMLGAGRSCDAYVCEIAAKGQTAAERYLFEELIYVVKGRGATSVWQEGGRKQTFEWHEGSMFSAPLNCWRQHFNAQGDAPARFVALTDAPVMINRFRNLNFVLDNNFAFADRFNGEEGYFSGQGREVTAHRTWDSNFIADIPNFGLMDHSARGQGARGILLHFAANTMSRPYRRISRRHLSARPLAWSRRAYFDSLRRRLFVALGARQRARAH